MIRATSPKFSPRGGAPEPAWEIAHIYPNQGSWSDADYLSLHTNHLVEFADGCIEVLPMPTTAHQLIVQYLSNLLFAFASARMLGTVLFAPLRVRLWPEKFREPDIVFMRKENAARIGELFWEGADLVMEVVSDSDEDRQRDYDAKRRDYEQAGIPEYWIVDPKTQRITALVLKDGRYTLHGEFLPGQQVDSNLLKGFVVDVSAVFASARS